MDEWELWLKQARRFLDAAKNNLNEVDEASYYLAMIAGELSLKAVLKHCGIFARRDEIHDMIILLERIENHQCLPSDILSTMKDIIAPSRTEEGLSHVDVGIVDPVAGDIPVHDCERALTSQIRYPKGSFPPFEYIKHSDAEKKVNLSEDLISMLESHFNV